MVLWLRDAPCWATTRNTVLRSSFANTPQNYGQEPLAAMVSWLRDAARKLGHSSPWEPPLLASQETHAYEQVGI